MERKGDINRDRKKEKESEIKAILESVRVCASILQLRVHLA